MLIIQPKSPSKENYDQRKSGLLLVILAAMTILFGRAVYLQVLDHQFLQHQGDIRQLDVLPIPAHRGRVLDRNGELLAISTPVKSIWINPRELLAASGGVAPTALGDVLGIPARELQKRIERSQTKSFLYLKRRINPELADQVMAMNLPGVYAEREYQRYYPTGEVTAHLLGFTDIEDRGQEGMERSFDASLRGTDGAKSILRDGMRRVIGSGDSISEPIPGKDLTLSIDQRLQYLAYRELKKAVLLHQAKAASLVVLDTHNGEVLAMVNQPSFNPNSSAKPKGNATRNRALTDLFEPGSTIKPFAVACALELRLYRPETIVDTNPGQMHVGHNLVRDVHNYGVLDVSGVLQKSSNVGVTKIALAVPPRKFWAFFNNLGFGQPLDTSFPGEVTGRLAHYQGWNAFEQATLSFGYGVSTSATQLARAYLALANDGVMPMVSLQRREKPPEIHRILSEKTAVSVRTMLERVVTREGTALKASIPGFRVAGKTGTVKKTAGRGYAQGAHLSLFAGMAPASKPRLLMVVMVDQPTAGEYYGGAVAAPVFSSVMEGALRMLNVPPDQPLPAPVISAQQDRL